MELYVEHAPTRRREFARIGIAAVSAIAEIAYIRFIGGATVDTADRIAAGLAFLGIAQAAPVLYRMVNIPTSSKE